jgi:hypothetical protein
MFSARVSMLSAKAVVKPMYSPRNASRRANEWARGKNSRFTSPSSAVMMAPQLCTMKR